MLGSAKTILPLLTLTSWVKGTSSFGTSTKKGDKKKKEENKKKEEKEKKEEKFCGRKSKVVQKY